MVLAAHDAVLVALGEEAPELAVPFVEGTRIDPVQVAHSGAERRPRRADEQVVVRPHQAPGEHLPAVPTDDLLEQTKEELAVRVHDEEPPARGRPHRDVKDAAGLLGAVRAWHVSSVQAREALRQGSA